MLFPTYRFMASIDDAGDVAVISGSSVSIGHRAAGGCDLEFLGGVANDHGRLELEPSFYAGLVWTLRLHADSPVASVGGRDLKAGEAHSLLHGDEVRLGSAAEFRVRQPDAASASVILELVRGTEVDGARRVLLLAAGESARARIGSRGSRHLVVPGLEADIELLRPEGAGADGKPRAALDAVLLRCAAGVRLASGSPDGATEWSTPLPLGGRVFLSSGADPGRLPPFGIALRPLSR